MKSSRVERDKFSVVAWNLTGIQHSGGGGKIIPPAWNGERECSGEDFEPLCDGTTRRRSLADLRLLEGV